MESRLESMRKVIDEIGDEDQKRLLESIIKELKVKCDKSKYQAKLNEIRSMLNTEKDYKRVLIKLKYTDNNQNNIETVFTLVFKRTEETKDLSTYQSKLIELRNKLDEFEKKMMTDEYFFGSIVFEYIVNDEATSDYATKYECAFDLPNMAKLDKIIAEASIENAKIKLQYGFLKDYNK